MWYLYCCVVCNNIICDVAVTSAGAVLSLPSAGVTLTIPEGAVPPGQEEEVYLAVANDTREKPPLNGKGRDSLTNSEKCPPTGLHW